MLRFGRHPGGSIYIYIYIFMYICMRVCMYVYVCVYIYIYIYIISNFKFHVFVFYNLGICFMTFNSESNNFNFSFFKFLLKRISKSHLSDICFLNEVLFSWCLLERVKCSNFDFPTFFWKVGGAKNIFIGRQVWKSHTAHSYIWNCILNDTLHHCTSYLSFQQSHGARKSTNKRGPNTNQNPFASVCKSSGEPSTKFPLVRHVELTTSSNIFIFC